MSALYFYPVLATRFTLSKAFSDVWNSNLKDWLFGKMDEYGNKISTYQTLRLN